MVWWRGGEGGRDGEANTHGGADHRGVEASGEGNALFECWSDRLADERGADRVDVLHVDEMWVDLIPRPLADGVVISRDPGLSAAQWNMYERQVTMSNGAYLIDDQRLIPYHQSSFDPVNSERLLNERQNRFTFANPDEYRDMMESHARELLANGYVECLSWPHSFTALGNCVRIFHSQRRMFRKIMERQEMATDPFSAGPGSFYELLKGKGPIVKRRSRAEFLQAGFRGGGVMVSALKRCLLVFNRVVGIKRYYLLTRWFSNNLRPEDPSFRWARAWMASASFQRAPVLELGVRREAATLGCLAAGAESDTPLAQRVLPTWVRPMCGCRVRRSVKRQETAVGVFPQTKRQPAAVLQRALLAARDHLDDA